MPRPLDSLAWDNRTVRLPPQLYARVAPEPLPAPYLVSFNAAAAALVDLDPAAAADPAFIQTVAGARALPGADPVALRYAGHQFGVYVPQLGDGRALLLGEVVGADGARTEIQLKGSGRTPFSRSGDGRAVLRSTIREYLCSEAMHGLHIPTTRALAIVGSDHPVYRERVEPAAVLVRLASTHIRFGSFEMYAHIAQPGFVRELADFVLAHHLPHLPPGDYGGLLHTAAERTARTVAAWQAVGFTHGVLNTDNMSILGLTLDYGPFAFMETFDPLFVPNHTDSEGRYAYGRQPTIALWNLGCLAHALKEIVPVESARAALASYARVYAAAYEQQFAAKLGFTEWRGEDDQSLLADLFKLLARQRADYPTFFRALSRFDLPAAREQLGTWAERYAERLAVDGRDPAERRAAMDRANPKYVLRTHLAQRAIERAERKDFAEVDRLLAILRDPFAEQPAHDDYAAPGGESHVQLSCSS